jgi:hypothetical protein
MVNAAQRLESRIDTDYHSIAQMDYAIQAAIKRERPSGAVQLQIKNKNHEKGMKDVWESCNLSIGSLWSFPQTGAR